MTRIASLETVGPCLICEGSGKRTRHISHDGIIHPWHIPGTTCTHCHGSGLRPQKQVCTWCHGIGGYSKRYLASVNAVTDPEHRTPPNGCLLCRGNGFIHLRLAKGQEFNNDNCLP